MSGNRPPSPANAGKLSPLLSRRHFLSNSATGLGGVALAWLLNREQARASSGAVSSGRAPQFRPRAKRVVQVFCCGGVSHLDTFDFKPELERMHGKSLEGKGENLGFFGQPGKLMKSVYGFRQHGQSGSWVSSLLPNLAGCADDLCFIHSMFAKSNNHTPATFQMNTGFTLNGFPCMGAWLSYGLGTENENLPAFVVLPDPRGLPAGGSINWASNSQTLVFNNNTEEPRSVDLWKVDADVQSRVAIAGRCGRSTRRVCGSRWSRRRGAPRARPPSACGR